MCEANKELIIGIIHRAATVIANDKYIGDSDTKPKIFLADPFKGTVAMVSLYGITHPNETVKAMDVIYNLLQDAGIDACVIAHDLSILDININ